MEYFQSERKRLCNVIRQAERDNLDVLADLQAELYELNQDAKLDRLYRLEE